MEAYDDVHVCRGVHAKDAPALQVAHRDDNVDQRFVSMEGLFRGTRCDAYLLHVHRAAKRCAEC